MNYTKRLKTAYQQALNLSADALLITDPTDIFYLTGQVVSTGKLLLKQGRNILFVDSRYFESCRASSPTEVVLAPPAVYTHFVEGVDKLGIDSEKTSLQAFYDLETSLKSTSISILPLISPVRQLRAIKDAEEIDLLRQAAKLGSEGFDHVLSLLVEGITEAELALAVEIFWRKKGASKVAFDPIIAFGEHSSMPHYRAGKAKLKSDDTVLIDIGVVLNHYHSDMTRTVFFGKPPPGIARIRAVVEEAAGKALSMLKPGVAIADLDDIARQHIADNGYGDYFTHSLGHGVGLEIHEFPTVRRSASGVLEAGMVITIEPGIYIPKLGGVRIEDTVLITTDGHENLTNRPKIYQI